MTRDKDRKRLVRERMMKTGESYTAARAHLLSRPTPRPGQPPPPDLGARVGIAGATIEARTGRTWQQWVRLLDADNAAALPHRDIARLVSGKYGVSSWWTQTVTVGYERIKGLREPGQRRDGAYEANKSRTYAVPVKTLFRAWADDAIRRKWLAGVESAVRTATEPRSVRLQWPDGTIVVAGFEAKGVKKSMVALTHTKLRTRAASDGAKKAWTERLDSLGALLSVRTT